MYTGEGQSSMQKLCLRIIPSIVLVLISDIAVTGEMSSGAATLASFDVGCRLHIIVTCVYSPVYNSDVGVIELGVS